MNIFEICSKFKIKAVATKVIKKGIINNSWEVTDYNGEEYIVQEINSNIFKDIDSLMNNIVRVTNHIKQKLVERDGDTSREVLNIIPYENKNYFSCEDENKKVHYYRAYKFIKNASTYDEADEILLYQAGIGFGKFQSYLADFEADSLYESIPNFHNTLKRFQDFEQVLDNISFETYEKTHKEIREILKCYKYADIIMKPLHSGAIPKRVVHNDTKLNNVMLDDNTHEAVCVIDLDTIMPGSLLFDYGDAIRYCANKGSEDDVNLDNVKFDFNKFVAFTYGFMEETYQSLTPNELKLMCKAPLVLTYELALRFLTDYLNGNVYFKCDPTRKDHNLERTRAQLKLLKEFEQNEEKMRNAIYSIYYKCLNNK